MQFRARAFWPLAIVTLIAAVIVTVLAAGVAQPIDPGCIEFCSVGQIVATEAISLVSLFWLAVVLMFALRRHRQEPAIGVLSAVAAAVFLALLSGLDTYLWSTPSSYDSPVFVFDQLALVLATGVQLPAIWRLGSTARPPIVGRVVVAVAGLAAFVVAFAFVALGTTPFDSGPQVQFVGYLAFTASLAVLVAAAWSRAGRERPGLALVGAAALFYAVVGTYYDISPLDSTAILLVAGPIMAAGWLWIGLAWLRSPLPLAPNEGANGDAPVQTQAR